MKTVLYIVTGQYRKRVAENVAFLSVHFDSNEKDNEQILETCKNYIEAAMKSKASDVAISVANYFTDAEFFKELAKKYNYEIIEIKTIGG